MDFAFSPEDDAFRAELRAWLDEHVRTMERRRAWQREMNAGGWAAINWPKEWGGREATIMQNVIYSEEMARYRTPGIFNTNGIWQIGPMIIRWGTDDQK